MTLDPTQPAIAGPPVDRLATPRRTPINSPYEAIEFIGEAATTR